MDAVFSTASELSPDERRALQARRDGPAAWRLSIQVLGLIASAVAVVLLEPSGGPLFVLALVGLATFEAALFAAMHECGHSTAFATRWLNELGLQIGAAVMLMPPTGFRHFHFEHHRKSHVEGDPELPGGTLELAGWPRNPIAWLIVLSGQPLMLGKLLVVVATALGRPPRWWERWMPYVPERVRGRVAWESRALLLGLLALFALAVFVDHRVYWLLAGFPLAHVLLGPYLVAEHTGLASEGDVLDRTRSMKCSAVVRWLFWNMPLHAEHHGWPAVPFHALPALHERISEALPHRGRGYLAVHVQGLKAALRLGPAIETTVRAAELAQPDPGR